MSLSIRKSRSWSTRPSAVSRRPLIAAGPNWHLWNIEPRWKPDPGCLASRHPCTNRSFAYVERFNRRDWDGLRELISADARLLVADRYSGSFADGGYLGVYSRMTVTWRLTLDDVDGEPLIILLNQRNGAWEIEGIIRLDIGADGRIERISGYQHCPRLLTAGSVVVREIVG